MVQISFENEREEGSNHLIPPSTIIVAAREFTDPTTGEIIQLDDVDSMLDSLERITAWLDRLHETKKQICFALDSLCEGNQKTRRVRGRRRQAKVETPDDYWDQSILKEAFNAYPQLRDECLAIASIRVKLREFKKIQGTKGTADFNSFRDMIAQANRGPSGTPRVVIEEINK